FALYLGLHGVLRWWQRRSDPLHAREVVHIVALGALATVTGFAWQVIASIATGESDAYLQTELAWRRSWLGDDAGGFVPFESSVQASGFWFGHWGLQSAWGPVGLVVLVVAVVAVLLRSRAVRRLGPDIRLWSASYLL